ncbi:hypothetical protein J1614_011033 [Plenodomus biglobosus]|nr:hypothetical protein J1614_011033 [Plenodomus biglobosus]
MAHRANRAWLQTELIPFLNTVFTARERWESWDDMIVRAERNIDHWVSANLSGLHDQDNGQTKRPIQKFSNTYRADFPASIEALRLFLINPELTTHAERKPYAGLKDCKTQDSVTIFVRHAINHGTYHLASHGDSPCREFPRGEDMARLLPFYASFVDVRVAEEETHVQAAPQNVRSQDKKRKASAGAGGGERGYHRAFNGQQFHRPVQPRLQQPYQYGQQFHQPDHYQTPQLLQYGQQLNQPLTTGYQQWQHDVPQVRQPPQPYNYVQHTPQSVQYHSQQTYNFGQWAPHPSGGWYMVPSHTMPHMGYITINDTPQYPGNQMNSWQIAPHAFHPGHNEGAPAFHPTQDRH